MKVTSWLGGMDHIDVALPTYSSRYARYVTEEVSHERIEKRECLVFTPGTTMELMLGEKFKGVKSVVKITSERLVMASKECSKENKYYITSIGLDASKLPMQYVHIGRLRTTCIGNWMSHLGRM